ncbi:hypothetical protein EDB85DRAFT_2222919 [Lactarius pseudohatsudake]|nr:hypothetical protein EDB85DRAFT_2222919 [Lactarius pseudohatsudake]
MWACHQFPDVAAQRRSAWYPNHDAREDSDAAAAAEALRQCDSSHDSDGNVMEGRRWGRRWVAVTVTWRRGNEGDGDEREMMGLPAFGFSEAEKEQKSLMMRDVEVGEVAVKGKELKLYSHILAQEYQRRHEKNERGSKASLHHLELGLGAEEVIAGDNSDSLSIPIQSRVVSLLRIQTVVRLLSETSSGGFVPPEVRAAVASARTTLGFGHISEPTQFLDPPHWGLLGRLLKAAMMHMMQVYDPYDLIHSNVPVKF